MGPGLSGWTVNHPDERKQETRAATLRIRASLDHAGSNTRPECAIETVFKTHTDIVLALAEHIH